MPASEAALHCRPGIENSRCSGSAARIVWQMNGDRLVSPLFRNMSDKFYSRREFMGIAVAGAAGVITRPVFAADTDPDLVVINAKIYTMDPRLPRAEAFAVSDGKFIAVGSTSGIRSLARRRTRI